MTDKNEIIEAMAKALYEANKPNWPDIDDEASWKSSRETWTGYAKAALEAIEAAGFVVVPREPTEYDLGRLNKQLVREFGIATSDGRLKRIYKTMTEAVQEGE